jgi:hypothetical protein
MCKGPNDEVEGSRVEGRASRKLVKGGKVGRERLRRGRWKTGRLKGKSRVENQGSGKSCGRLL